MSKPYSKAESCWSAGIPFASVEIVRDECPAKVLLELQMPGAQASFAIYLDRDQVAFLKCLMEDARDQL